MTLNVSTKDCKNVDLTQDQMYAIGIALMSVGIPEVTAKNWQDVASRVGALESIYGPYFAPTYMTPSDWFKLVGVRTNVSRMTKTAWNHKLAHMATQKGQDRFYRNSAGVFGEGEPV